MGVLPVGPILEREGVVVAYDDAMAMLATWRNGLYIFWRATPDVRMIHRTVQLSEPLARRYPDGTISMSVTMQGVGLPDNATRQAASDALRDRPAKRTAIVLEGEGFWLSAARMALSAMTRLSGQRQTGQQICGSFDEAATHLLPCVPPEPRPLTHAQLAELLRAMRERATPKPA